MKAYLVQGFNWIFLEERRIPRSMERIEINLKPIKFNERFRTNSLEKSLGMAILKDNSGIFVGKDKIKPPIIGKNLYLVHVKCPDAVNADYR